MTRIRLNVTQKHIDEGTPWYMTSCPIALALVDRGYGSVYVRAESWEAREDDGSYIAGPLPTRAREFIKLYDDRTTRYSVQPSTFVLSTYP